MSNFVDALEKQLKDAAVTQAATRAHPPRRRSRLRRGLPFWAAGVIVIGAPAVAATIIWHPTLGDGKTPAPSASVSPTPAAQREALSVLRRAQTPHDRQSAATALKYLRSNVRGVRVADIRAVSNPNIPGGVVLVPVERYDIDSANLPAGAAHRAPKADGLCLFVEDRQGGQEAGGGWSCFSTAQVLAGEAGGGIGSTRYGVLPDGVAKLAITYTQGDAITAPVDDNVFAYLPPRDKTPPDRSTQPVETRRWIAGDGAVLKTITGLALLSGVQTRSMACDPKVPAGQCARLKSAPPYRLP